MKSSLRIAVCIALVLFGKTLSAQEVTLPVINLSARQENGFLKIMGEVQNNTENAVCYVRIDIQLFDDKGTQLGVERFTAREAGVMADDGVFAERDVIPAGETGAFNRVRDLSKIKGKVASQKVVASGVVMKNTNFSAMLSAVKIDRQGNSFLATGTYQSNGKAACISPKVVAVGYGKDGKVQEVSTFALTSDGTFSGELVKTLAPGQNLPFRVRVSSPSGLVESVKVFPSYRAE